MSISAGRALVFFMIGLPIGFILTALGFVVTDREIDAGAMAPWALAIAAATGLVAAFGKPSR
ncbi:hypothetical protein AMC99_01442 [Altererythrobacter epoxidivorans]|uniref:Uncharacterized protein n=1 Tax=Altererythrobacter epoxidivorans TaxID=361183 RepID=A0A0M4M842_9SPHN|nr:hypothetical protein AMC99_01442 [Altererythrobacter epoxidivorans]